MRKTISFELVISRGRMIQLGDYIPDIGGVVHTIFYVEAMADGAVRVIGNAILTGRRY